MTEEPAQTCQMISDLTWYLDFNMQHYVFINHINVVGCFRARPSLQTGSTSQVCVPPGAWCHVVWMWTCWYHYQTTEPVQKTWINVLRLVHAHTYEYIFRNLRGTVLRSCFVSGGTESVGTPDSEWSLFDRRKKAARGHRAHSRTGCINLTNVKKVNL